MIFFRRYPTINGILGFLCQTLVGTETIHCINHTWRQPSQKRGHNPNNILIIGLVGKFVHINLVIG